MSVTLTRGDRRLLLSAGGVFLLLVLTALVLSTTAIDRTENPTTYSAGSTGAKAAYLLLQASGYRTERWEQPLRELTDPASTTLILAEPIEMPTAEDRRLIQQFLEHGGRVIATGLLGADLLGGAARPDPIGALTWTRMPANAPSAIGRAAPAITLATQASWDTTPNTGGAPRLLGVPLYGDDATPVVVHALIARGDAFWWASATPLTNAGLREPGNLEFFLACLGPRASRRVLWDEYFHGRRRSLAASMLHSPVKWMFLQLGVFALAILLTYSRRSGPIVPPAPESRLSPLEFVRTLGSLYQRAGAASVAVGITYQRFRYWLTRRLGVASTTPVDDLARAAGRRWNVDPAALGATLQSCEDAREDAALESRRALALIRSLDDHASALQLFGRPMKEKS